jgi:type I restriction enzyme M protein
MDAQSLRSIIKSARDLMRKDAGLNTDVDRIPQLAWIMFLKCFDDFEKNRSALYKDYKEAIPKGYRWQDWAASEDEKGNKKKVLTGSDLIKFVNDNLFPALAGLVGSKGFEQRDVIASIFKELNNRILSGFVLRQILDLVNKVNFVSTDDIHTMAKLYEDMLVEMRDAAGSNGEFYTPRPVIRFIVNQIKPDLEKSERVLDPACGTGGFLVESLELMKQKEKSKADYKKLHENTLFGIEKKPMPYLLGMMNMLLHEVDKPNIVRTNTLAKPFREITEKDQYDVIMTNPPFGGEEEIGISSNLPVGMQTSDTALAFLLYIMYTLKDKGRCGIILPNGPFFAGGIAAKIKQKLLEEFNLHTIIRMPPSVFSPYAGIATNILFFEKKGKTKEIWYYQMKLREGIKAYSKTKPILYEDFADVIAWYKNKKENGYAWKIKLEDIKDYNLDVKNPSDLEEALDLSPHELIDQILNDEEKTMILLKEVKELINKEIPK